MQSVCSLFDLSASRILNLNLRSAVNLAVTQYTLRLWSSHMCYTNGPTRKRFSDHVKHVLRKGESGALSHRFSEIIFTCNNSLTQMTITLNYIIEHLMTSAMCHSTQYVKIVIPGNLSLIVVKGYCSHISSHLACIVLLSKQIYRSR